MPVPPAWLSTLLLAAGAAALVAFVVRELVAFARGEPVEPLGVALVVSTNLVWSGLLLWLSHPALPLYAIALGHYVQQLAFVWRVPATHEQLARLRPGRRLTALWWVLGLTVVAGAVVAALTLVTVGARGLALALTLRAPAALVVPPWVAAMVGVNLSHYWLEHRIWRRPAPA
jgi:hypothetical protein